MLFDEMALKGPCLYLELKKTCYPNPAKINTNIGKIEIFESNSVQGKGVQHKINNRDNQTKAILSARYEDLMSE